MKTALPMPLAARRSPDVSTASRGTGGAPGVREQGSGRQALLGAEIQGGSRTVQQQRKLAQLFAPPPAGQAAASPAPAPASPRGLPGPLRQGLESLSGFDLSDVRVHRASSRPAQFSARAFAQGNQIHLAPGQDHLLAHEAWHVVQQKQGRVAGTVQWKGEKGNEDSALEREADTMGARALAFQGPPQAAAPVQRRKAAPPGAVMQRVRYLSKDRKLDVDIDAGDNGCVARTKGYDDSSLEYRVNYYRDQRKEEIQRTRAPIATQTDTMHSHPEKSGIGTLVLYYTLSHLRDRGIRYFQPDAARTGGGNKMLEMVGGTRLNTEQMTRIISEAEGGGGGGGGCSAFLRFITCGLCGGSPEEAPLLPDISPEPAYQINNIGLVVAGLGVKVGQKFDRV